MRRSATDGATFTSISRMARRAFRRRLAECGCHRRTPSSSTEEVAAAGITIPAHLVSAVAEVPLGCIPPRVTRVTPTTDRTPRSTCVARRPEVRNCPLPGPVRHGCADIGCLPKAHRRGPPRRAWPMVGIDPGVEGVVHVSQQTHERSRERTAHNSENGGFSIDEWFVVLRSSHHPRSRGRLPRLRQPVCSSGHARGTAHPRPGHAAGRRRHLCAEP